MNEYKIGSLFAGVGGICQAFKDASCNVVWANELDANSCKTYRLNHPKTTLFQIDVRELKAETLSEIDILTAGFPCQPFSQAGHGKGFEDDRGKLFTEVVRILREKQPRAYLLENVKTLATHNGGKSFEFVREAITNAGYSFIPFILKASEYTDIPQGRERIYIVGFKDEFAFSHTKPVKTNLDLFFDKEKCPYSASFTIPPKLTEKPRSIEDFLDNSTSLDADYYNKPENEIHKKVIDFVLNGDTVYQYRRYYVRENKSKVCPTLTANMGGGGHNIPIILDGTTPRRLTPKECFNLQGFSENFKLPDIPRGHLYKQSGNSVVVPLVNKIAKEIVRVLDENRSCQS
jgi:DNA (cytosine-5)-methyltransferase 1